MHLLGSLLLPLAGRGIPGQRCLSQLLLMFILLLLIEITGDKQLCKIHCWGIFHYLVTIKIEGRYKFFPVWDKEDGWVASTGCSFHPSDIDLRKGLDTPLWEFWGALVHSSCLGWDTDYCRRREGLLKLFLEIATVKKWVFLFTVLG